MPLPFKTNKYPLNVSPHNIIIVETIFNGPKDTKDLKLVFDTGASLTTMPAEIAIAIGCDPINAKKRIEIITASGILYVPIVKIPKIEVLGFSLKNIEVAALIYLRNPGYLVF